MVGVPQPQSVQTPLKQLGVLVQGVRNSQDPSCVRTNSLATANVQTLDPDDGIAKAMRSLMEAERQSLSTGNCEVSNQNCIIYYLHVCSFQNDLDLHALMQDPY